MQLLHMYTIIIWYARDHMASSWVVSSRPNIEICAFRCGVGGSEAPGSIS